ncbi:MAG TPA: hypothetical protein VGE55_09130 [Limnobacter sp.]|uniref:hypothetical protein n=1 Tax=Limnobacter sp. TaxID=2003368 RepID=UPI002ED96CAB
MTRAQSIRYTAGLLLSATLSLAHAFGISVAPTAVMINPKTGFAHLELSNQSNQTRLFTVEAGDPAQTSCYRVSPKQISLPPNGTQTVRLQYTCALQDLTDQSLLYFTEMPSVDPSTVASSQLEFRLRLGLKVKTQQSVLGSLF